MIIIINNGLNKKGAKKMNEFIELRKKQLKSPKFRFELAFWGINNIYPEKCKPVKVGDKIGKVSKVYKRDWDSIKNYITMGTHLGYTIPLDHINYEIIER
jgi:hypothetical protein